MGRPRRDSNKSDSGSTAGNVYNASLAAAQQQKVLDSSSPSLTASSSLTPQLEVISLVAAAADIENKASEGSVNDLATTSSSITSTTPISPISPVTTSTSTINDIPTSTPASTTTNSQQGSTANIHRRSLSIAELVSLVSSTRNGSAANFSSNTPSSAASALSALNLPDALRNTLEKADSPILNALLPLIRQKLAAKTALNRRNSSVDVNGVSPSLSSTSSIDTRRSSTSSRSEDHRLSHKLAERKRRKEMKDVFDNLKNSLPPGVPKSSKWEILNEASTIIDELLDQEQALLNQRNQLLKRINESS